MAPGRALHFGPFRLDLADERLWRGDEAVTLSPKAFGVLAFLVGQPDRLARKEDLLEAVWPDAHVADGVLKLAVAELRRALGDQAKAPDFIQTVHRRGYRFIGTVESAHPIAAIASAEIVGREAPLAALQRSHEAALTGSRGVILVTGEAGIGKTALIEAFARLPLGSDLLIARGQCRERYGEGEAFQPILEALGALGRSDSGDFVTDVLRTHAPSWLVQLPSLVDEAERADLERTTRDTRRARMLREIAEAFEALSRERPLLLVLEDLHWSDPSTLDLFSMLARRTDPACLLLVGSYRPIDANLAENPVHALTRELVAAGRAGQIPLAPLDEAQVEAYLCEQLGALPPARLGALIHRRSEGTPLFMVAHLSDILAQDCLAKEETGWELRRPLEEIEALFPSELKGILERQIERLAADEIQLLECASVVGRDFGAEQISNALGEDLAAVELALETLGRREHFVRATGARRLQTGGVAGSYQFGHVLQQHALYQRIGAARRAGLHAKVAEQLMAAGASPAQIAYHCHAAGLREAAIDHWQQAGTLAIESWANVEAIQHIDHALELLAELPETPERDARELALLISIGTALNYVVGPGAPRIAQAYDRAATLCERQEAGPALYPMMAGLFTFYVGRARYPEAREMATRLMQVAAPLGVPLISRSALLVEGIARLYTGQLTGAVESMDRSLELADQGEYHWGHPTECLCYLFSSLALQILGRPSEARARVDRGIAIAREGDDANLLTMALQFSTDVARWQRDVGLARQHAEQAAAISEEEGLELWGPVTAWTLGWVQAEEGDLEGGLAAMRDNLAHYAEMGTETARTDYLAAMGACCLRAGDVDAGLALIEEALERIGGSEERYAEAEVYRLRGALLAMTPDQDEAEASVLRALEIAREQDAHTWELRAWTTLCDLREDAAGLEDARAGLARIVASFDPESEPPDLQDARMRLSPR